MLESQRRHSHCPLPTRILADGCPCTLPGTTWVRMSTAGIRIPYRVRENKGILELSFQPLLGSTVFSFPIVGPNFSTPQKEATLSRLSSLTDTRVYSRGRRRRRRHPAAVAGPLCSCLLPSGCPQGARSTQGGPLACEGSGEGKHGAGRQSSPPLHAGPGNPTVLCCLWV